MPDAGQFPENPRTSERRLYPRKQLWFPLFVAQRLLYPRKQPWFPSIQLRDGNGGIILDISESGLAMRAVTSLTDSQLIAMRLRRSESQVWIETRGRIAWINASRNKLGVEFVGLSNESRERIKDWVSSIPQPSEFARDTEAVENDMVNRLVAILKAESLISTSESEITGGVVEDQNQRPITGRSIADLPRSAKSHSSATQDSGPRRSKPATTEGDQKFRSRSLTTKQNSAVKFYAASPSWILKNRVN